jgi:signal recognition particle GTPase
MSILKKNFELLKDNYSQLTVEMMYNERTSDDSNLDNDYNEDNFESLYEKDINPNASQSVIDELVEWYEEEFGELSEDDRDNLEDMIKEEYLFLDE